METRLNILTETLALNTNQISLATQRTKEETRRYRQGHGSSSLVLQAQDDEQSAKISYAHAQKPTYSPTLRARINPYATKSILLGSGVAAKRNEASAYPNFFFPR